MKTLIVFSAGFILAALVLTGFTNNSAPERETRICHDCKTDNFKEIPINDFFADIARYNGTHVKGIRNATRQAQDNNPKVEPARVCIYSLDTLKKFICFIETYAKAAQIPTDSLGINFYYAVYPKRKHIGDHNVGSLHTLYLTPTYYDARNEMYMPIHLKALATFRMEHPNIKYISPRRFSLDSLRNSLTYTTAFMMSASTFESTTTSFTTSGGTKINQGQLCPPACSGVSITPEAKPF